MALSPLSFRIFSRVIATHDDPTTYFYFRCLLEFDIVAFFYGAQHHVHYKQITCSYSFFIICSR